MILVGSIEQSSNAWLHHQQLMLSAGRLELFIKLEEWDVPAQTLHTIHCLLSLVQIELSCIKKAL